MIVRDRYWLTTSGELLSQTPTQKLYVPAAVGVPERIPFVDKFIVPGGKLPVPPGRYQW